MVFTSLPGFQLRESWLVLPPPISAPPPSYPAVSAVRRLQTLSSGALGNQATRLNPGMHTPPFYAHACTRWPELSRARCRWNSFTCPPAPLTGPDRDNPRPNARTGHFGMLTVGRRFRRGGCLCQRQSTFGENAAMRLVKRRGLACSSAPASFSRPGTWAPPSFTPSPSHESGHETNGPALLISPA